MSTDARIPTAPALTLCAAVVLLTACDAAGPAAPANDLRRDAAAERMEGHEIARLRRATVRYHDVNAAIADGFVLLHGCEVRPGEGAVGILYVHLERFMDGVIDPDAPDGLLYEVGRNGSLRLTGTELAVPRATWPSAEPPEFLGVEFQVEEEFDAYGLHIWIWKRNPEGMFAQANPRISCGAEP
jgi:hypothetical protein